MQNAKNNPLPEAKNPPSLDERAPPGQPPPDHILAAVLENTPMLAAYLDTRFNFTWVNFAYAKAGRQSPAYFVGRNYFDLYPTQVYARMLDILVHATGSEYGFLDEVACDPDGHPIKRSLSISEISWDADSGRLYQDLKAQRFEFHSLDNLAGAPVIEKRIIIANDAPNDPHAKGLPEGHPVIRRYLGIPLYFRDEIIGVVGVANRPDDYTEEIAAFIQPLTRACSAMIQAGRMARREAEALAALKASEKRYRSMAETANEGIWAVDADFRTTYVNQRMADMLGFTPPEILGRSTGQAPGPAAPGPEDGVRRPAGRRGGPRFQQHAGSDSRVNGAGARAGRAGPADV
jgi:PAS domain-containing protein